MRKLPLILLAGLIVGSLAGCTSYLDDAKTVGVACIKAGGSFHFDNSSGNYTCILNGQDITP